MKEELDNIEAKLCAYIDGELNETDRRQIEQHLAANPQLKGMVDEMMGQRDVIRGLPRESAPEDIAEAIQAQMERLALLDGREEEPVIAGRIGQWRQVFAMAAMVLITAGLGIIIYVVLHPERPTPVAIAPHEARTNEKLGAGLAETSAVDRPAVDRNEKTGVAEPSAAAKGGGGAGSLDKLLDNKLDEARVMKKGKIADKAEESFSEVAAIEEYLDRSGKQTDNPAVVVVVPSEDVSQTKGQVKEYLASNNISYESVGGPLPTALATGPRPTMKELSVINSAPISPEREATVANEGWKKNARGGPYQTDQSAGVNNQEKTSVPEAPVAAAQTKYQGKGGEVTGNLPQATQPPAIEPGQQVAEQQAMQYQQVAQARQREAAFDGMYVVRNLTQRQADELCANLSQPVHRDNQQVMQQQQRQQSQLQQIPLMRRSQSMNQVSQVNSQLGNLANNDRSVQQQSQGLAKALPQTMPTTMPTTQEAKVDLVIVLQQQVATPPVNAALKPSTPDRSELNKAPTTTPAK